MRRGPSLKKSWSRVKEAVPARRPGRGEVKEIAVDMGSAANFATVEEERNQGNCDGLPRSSNSAKVCGVVTLMGAGSSVILT